jgi:cation diffusion facilitator CzcD-associated flavoprotein CzcO
MVEVAVIGAGAAGLVSARQLLKLGYRTHIFERRSSLGGAWQASSQTNGRGWFSLPKPAAAPQDVYPQMWESLTPNLSKYTCCFSDFPWPESTPMFPSLSEMNQYLQDYAEYHILNHDRFVSHYGCTVTHVGRSTDTPSSYHVQWREEDGGEGVQQSQRFAGVVIATGFFSQPYWPVSWENIDVPLGTSPSIIHSSQYRSFRDYEGNGTVAIIGGSFSAQEIAAELARHTASKVMQIMGDRAPYVLPRNIMVQSPMDQGEGSVPEVVPIDFALYRRQQDGPSAGESIVLDEASCHKRHQTLRQWIGERKMQQALVRGYDMTADDESLPPCVSISDHYLDLVIDGKIQVRKGRVQAIQNQPSIVPPFELILSDGTSLQNIDHIIACTGYQCSLQFLDPEILQELQYDKTDAFVPIISCYDTFHPQLPNFGMVGMYKGPYFGVMELQAQLLARRWMLSAALPPMMDSVLADALRASETRRHHVPKAQFPHFDYIGLMDHLSSLLNPIPTESRFSCEKGEMVTPLLYRSDLNGNKMELYKSAMNEDLCRSSESCISRMALNAMLGQWTFDRVISDVLTRSEQHISGTIRFSWQGPLLASLRYREDGILVLPNGNQQDVFREYEYTCRNGNLEIDFVENGEPTYLFLSLQFKKYDQGFWIATSDHLCIKDLYKGTFQIQFDGLGASEIRMTYHVKGPNKDYESVTTLRSIL